MPKPPDNAEVITSAVLAAAQSGHKPCGICGKRAWFNQAAQSFKCPHCGAILTADGWKEVK